MTRNVDPRPPKIVWPPQMVSPKAIAISLGCLLVVGCILSTGYEVQPNQRAVITSAGAYTSVADPGYT